MKKKARKKTPTVKVVGKSVEGKSAFIGARRVGGQIRVRQEVTSRKGATPTVRIVTKTLASRPTRKAKSENWMDDPQLPLRLLSAFRGAVKSAKRAAARHKTEE
jgi:hypothetical protein